MNPDSIKTSASDSARWPSVITSTAEAMLDDPFASEVIKNACRLLLGGMRRDDAIRAACILANDRNHSTFAMENRLKALLHEAGVTA